jgi:hypothetical protein
VQFAISLFFWEKTHRKFAFYRGVSQIGFEIEREHA